MAIQIMKILFLWPPGLEKPINSYKRLLIFASTAAYIKEKFADDSLDLIDSPLLGLSWSKLLSKTITLNPDLVNIYVEPHTIASSLKTAKLIQSISSAKVLFFGSFSCINPEFLISSGADAVCYNGNYESAVASYIRYLKEGTAPSDITKRSGDKTETFAPSPALKPSEWSRDYYDFYDINILNSSLSFDHQGEGRIIASRGCGFACSFCKTRYYTPEPRKERFRSHNEIISDIHYLKKKFGFNKFNLNACNFTLDKKWALDLCKKLKPLNLAWNTMTRLDLLDEDIIAAMATSGCYKIGIGVETLSAKDQQKIKKPVDEIRLKEIVGLMKNFGIRPKTCIMAAIPGQSKRDLLYTFTRLLEWECSVRAKEFYPYNLLEEPKLNKKDIERFDRSDFYHQKINGLSKRSYLELLLHNRLPESEVRRNTSAGALVYRKGGKAISFYLLQKNDGEWYIPRGKIEQDEDMKRTVHREVAEETGMKIEIVTKLCEGENVFWSYQFQRPQIKKVHTYLATTKPDSAPAKITEEEWKTGRWVSPDEAKKLLKKNYLIECVDQALKYLKAV